MDSPSTASHLSLLDLVEPRRWQRLQDHFASVLGIAIRTVNPSRELLVTPSWPGSLSAEQVVKWLRVGEELEQLLPLTNPPHDTSSVTTTLGVTYAIIPIHATTEQIIAYFVVGPLVVGSREEELQFRQRLGAMGLDAQSLWPILLSLKLYTFAGIRSVLNLMEEVGTALTELAYQANRLAAILPSTSASRVDQAMVAFYTDRVLHSLFEAASLATRADGGSVMVYDPRSDAFRIKVAQGLSEEVIAKTQVKGGEGIAGLAASQRTILLIDEQTTDPRIRQQMARKDVTSSLVASLAPDGGQEPFGVINLRSTTPQKRFTQEHVELLRRLLDIAGAALSSLRVAFNQAPAPHLGPSPTP